MITETITFNFETEEQQRRFHEELDRRRAQAIATKDAAASIAQMVTEWVDGGIKGGTDWRPGLAAIIEKRLERLQ